MEKHQFLRSKLKGEPATLVETLPIDGFFYNKAWEVLLQHYDDPMKKIARHLDAILKTSPAKGSQLRSLITHFRAQVAALTITFAEKPDIDVLSQFAIHLFLSKTDKGPDSSGREKWRNVKNFQPLMISSVLWRVAVTHTKEPTAMIRRQLQ